MIKEFLKTLQEKNASVKVFLMNGVKLIGCVSGFDEEGILLTRNAHTQAIYYHAISTIDPE